MFSDVDNDNDLDLYLSVILEKKVSNQLLINEYPDLKFTNKSKDLNTTVLYTEWELLLEIIIMTAGWIIK